MRNRIPICIVPENEDYLEDFWDDNDRCGGIIYKNKDTGAVVEKFLDADEIKWFRKNIKVVKKTYKRFLLYVYDSEFHLWIFQDHPSGKSGVFKYFDEKYPANTWDILWNNS